MVQQSSQTSNKYCRILALDGGGAKGFYTLGILKEIEAMINQPLYEKFNLIFGTSTCAIDSVYAVKQI
jgi:patatin-like phospholipase/acyl hydrolase